jgi:two-component system, OmpR family, sensor histidine kinase KdpD
MSSQYVSPQSTSPWGLRRFLHEADSIEARRRTAARMAEDASWLSRDVVSTILGLLAVLAITTFFRHEPLGNLTTVGFVFLLAILIGAAFGGFPTSLSMSVAAALSYDYYFIPPVDQWNIYNPQDWVALGAFVTTAIVGSVLSVIARRQTAVARHQRQEAEELYDLSQRMLSAGDSVALCQAIPQDIADTFGVKAAALLVAEGQTVSYSMGGSHNFAASDLKASLDAREVVVDSANKISYVPLHLGPRAIGTLGIADTTLSRTTLEALGPLITIAIERAGAIEQVGKFEALRESERLKTALLDAITHEFRTPLTAMKISVTGMLSDIDFDRDQCRDLLGMINEGCDRIDHLVDEVTQMSRIESGNVKLDLAPHCVGELIDEAIGDTASVLGSRPVERRVANEDVPIRVDLAWASKILSHLLMNAHLYSAPDATVVIRTETANGLVIFRVADRGPGIDPAELDRIFEKFYRGKEHRCRIEGTGMGLPIARAIAEAHGGTLSAKSALGQGSEFSFSLPIDRSLD